MGSSYLPSELQAAYLYAQLLEADKIYDDRIRSWEFYHKHLKPLENKGYITLPVIPDQCKHNAHMFYIKTKDISERTRLLQYLKEKQILAVFHYVPLHSSEAGLVFGKFDCIDEFTTKESERIIRLPMYFGLTREDQKKVIDSVFEFYK